MGPFGWTHPGIMDHIGVDRVLIYSMKGKTSHMKGSLGNTQRQSVGDVSVTNIAQITANPPFPPSFKYHTNHRLVGMKKTTRRQHINTQSTDSGLACNQGKGGRQRLGKTSSPLIEALPPQAEEQRQNRAEEQR